MQLALYRPEIPPNTGNIARLCVLTDSPLHIIGKPSFSLDESAVRRAGLDYWDQLHLKQHKDWQSFKEYLTRNFPVHRIFLLSRFAKRNYAAVQYAADDVLVFGQESAGLPEFIHQEAQQNYPDQLLRIPVKPGVRSLNLANAAAIVLFEALRQHDFAGLEEAGPDLHDS